jgi:predicted metal-dependent phosphoesterase TrpH
MLLLALACPGPQTAPAPDLTERLGPGEARAGQVVDPASLFGGVSAEGQVGDFLLYNDRVQFVVQGVRAGHYYVPQAGGVVDADIVRPPGALGHDLVDDWATIMSVGRVAHGTEFQVLDDGVESGTAHLRVRGEESVFSLITGALESPDFVPHLGLRFTTDYVLPADSWTMQVTTTFVAGDTEATFFPGDLVQGSLDAASPWTPGVGMEPAGPGSYPWLGFTGRRGEGAVALLAADGGALQVESAAALMSSLAEMVVGSGETVTLAPGESASWTRLYGVAPDLATLASAHAPGQELGGDTVPGAQVAVYADGVPWALAQADAEGTWIGHAPDGADVTTLELGVGLAQFTDRAPGWGSYSTYTDPDVLDAVLDGMVDGAPESFTQARGWGAGELVEPGTLRVQVADAGPFEVQVAFADGAPFIDPQVFPGWPKGLAALGWARDGDIDVLVPPGEYNVLVHRGARFEVHQATVTVESGGTTELSASLPAGYSHEGWLAADPHAHAAPSADGECTMEDRVAVMAARGVQLHFGTDHDHVSDYRPLVEALGLEDHMASVVASEVSPVLRGHHNIYPLAANPTAPSGSEFIWYSELVETTQEMIDILRERYPDVLIQANHPLDSGVGEMADWEPGEIGKPDFWSPDHDAVEVINDGNREYMEYYLDLVNHGVVPMAVSVSDTHGCTSGDPGLHLTFLHMSSDPRDYTDDDLRATFYARSGVASMGPFIELTELPGSTVAPGTQLSAVAKSPSWIVVDELALLQDGVEVEVVAGTEATFELDPDDDASYIVVARGATAMAPVWPGRTPWAMTNAILVDVDGDGWDSPDGSY